MLLTIPANVNKLYMDRWHIMFLKKVSHAPDANTMAKLCPARLFSSKETQLIKAQDNAATVFTLYATLMLAIRCSHYSSLCLNAKWKQIWTATVTRSLRSQLVCEIHHDDSLSLSVSIAISFSPCSSLRVSYAGAQHSTASTVPQSASKGGNQ